MKENILTKSRKEIYTAIILLILNLIVAGVLFYQSKQLEQLEPVLEVEYIKAMEAQDADAIENAIYESRIDVQLEEIAQRIEEDPDYVWKALSEINTVFLGDSRIAAFRDYGFMDESRIIAEYGVLMEYVIDLDKLVAVNPRLVVMSFGLNDIGTLHFTPEDFAQASAAYVDQMQALLPDAYIYIQVPLPLSPAGATTIFPDWMVLEWSEGEAAYYEEHGYRYMDLGYLTETYWWMYAEDGFHFQRDFYPIWARAILERYLTDLDADQKAQLTAGMQHISEEQMESEETSRDEED